MRPETIRAVLRALNRARIGFLFFGLEALNTYAASPAESFVTKDSDFLVRMSPGVSGRVIGVLRKIRWPETVQIVYSGAPGGGSCTLYDGRAWKNLRGVGDAGTLTICPADSYYAVDLALGVPAIPYDLLDKHANRATLFGVKIRIASKEHILELKRLAGRDKDRAVLERFERKRGSIREGRK
ncbi:hypothetical protein HY522_08995 [bacterium]|nr:hypothetical protein [bacterium]